jgi:hypothetical protein
LVVTRLCSPPRSRSSKIASDDEFEKARFAGPFLFLLARRLVAGDSPGAPIGSASIQPYPLIVANTVEELPINNWIGRFS